MERENILLIMTDQQSAKAMSCMDNPHLQTPAIDGLAKNGVLFQQAYCCNPVCVPSRIGMFTGHFPHEAGIYLNARTPTRELRRLPWMGKIFAKAGYETKYFGKWHLLVEPFLKGIHGFQQVKITMGRDKDEQVAAACAREFVRDHKKPFLIVASLLNPHNVCQLARKTPLPEANIGVAPPPEQCPPLPANFTIPANEPDAIREAQGDSWKRYPTKGWTEADWRQYLWGYYRLVEHVDRIVGTILNALNSSQHARNTIVVFTADHGEGMAEHGWNQKQAFYDAVARVPFIISHPGSSIKGKSNRGLLVNSGVDVIPTLADLASVPLDNQKYKFPGKSIKDAVFEIDSAPPEHHVVSESEFGGFATNKWTHEDRAYGRMVRTPRFKYMAYSRGRVREFLVDMEADPGEMINLALDSRYTSELRRHRQLLKEWCIKTGDDFPVISE